MIEQPTSILYIGGYSRSGSTLLLRLLGQVEGLFPVGEVWDLWQRSFTENQLCGCGDPFHDCEFWNEVISQAFGSMAQVDVLHMQRLRLAVQGNRALPMLLVPALRSAEYRAKLNEYSQALSALYGAIRAVSGCRVIVDSSKVPPYAYLLRSLPELHLHVVHLVRDSRATAYSWKRKKQRPEIHWKTAYMARYSPARSAVEWSIMNGLLERVADQRARYEHLVSRPVATIQEILQNLSEGLREPFDLPWPVGEQVRSFQVGIDHTVSGNPNRFKQGAISIRPDTEWQAKMPRGHKLLVGGLTWPLLNHYGYLSGEGTPGDSTTLPTNARETGTAQPEQA
jgi:hypothetical protein